MRLLRGATTVDLFDSETSNIRSTTQERRSTSQSYKSKNSVEDLFGSDDEGRDEDTNSETSELIFCFSSYISSYI